MLAQVKALPQERTQEISSVPPGAHEDQFRRLRYPTEKSMKDPDRVFFTTTSYTEGIRFSHQPPWFFGYQNKTKPSDSSMTMTTNRYGYRGAKEINQFHTSPLCPSELTMNEHTPQFLEPQSMIDEWVPPLVGSPLNKGYALSTPILWPENSEYPNGFKSKKLPTSRYYQEETTTGTLLRPNTSPQLAFTMNHSMMEGSTLRENSKLESKHQIESRPQTAIKEFNRDWNNHVQERATPSLRQIMKTSIPPYEAHTLSNPDDRMVYSGSTAIIVHSSSTEEVKFKMHSIQTAVNVPFDTRWKAVISTYRTIRSRLSREQTSEQSILLFADALKTESYSHGQKAALLRLQFIKAMTTLPAFEHLSQKQMSLLFSVFDPLKKGYIIYCEIICALLILDNPMKYKADPKPLMVELWKLYDIYGNDQQSNDVAHNVLTACCGADSEYLEMVSLIKRVVRPILYNASVTAPPVGSDNHGAGTVGTAGVANGTSNSTANTVPIYKKHLIIQPVYNIYDSVFDSAMFGHILSRAPEVVDAFNRHLTARLVSCYGKDPRDVVEDVTVVVQTEKDFSWILKGRGKKK